MKVSIIIPTRNRRKLLMERALPSALNQNFDDFDIFIIDDASEDDTLKKVQALNDKRITVIKNKKRMGLAYNRNLGVELSTGEYIVSLDDDNEFHPDFLKETVDYIENYAPTEGLYGAVGVGKNVVYPEGTIYQKPPQSDFYASINDGFLIRRTVFNKVRFDETLHANEDSDFGLHFLKHFKLGGINKLLMTVYGSEIINKSSYSDYTDYHMDGVHKFVQKNWFEFMKVPKELGYIARMAGRIFYLGGRQHLAIVYMKGAKVYDPSFRNWLYWLTVKLRIFKPFYVTEQKIIRHLRKLR